MTQQMTRYTKDDFLRVKELLDIGIALSAEKDYRVLLERILSEARRMTHCDAGTLYFVEGNYLKFEIIQNETLGIFKGGKGEPINLPPVEILETAVAGHAAIHHSIINIEDVYASKVIGLDFSGPKRYDEMTGYHTQSMLVVPLENHDGEVIGVLQLINAKSETGEVVPFPDYMELVVGSLASQAAVSLTNMRFVEELNQIFNSFVEVISTAIDERSPYNANHTKNMAMMALKFGKYLSKNDTVIAPAAYFSENRVEQLVMAAWLHDIGKVAIPLEVMDKPTRLGHHIEAVINRLDRIAAERKVAVYEAQGDLSLIQKINDEMTTYKALISKMNEPSTFMDDELMASLEEIKQQTYINNGEVVSWLTPYEAEALAIKRGTLTTSERESIESHVVITRKMLDKIPFNKTYCFVKEWAPSHHEFVDGTGYPNHLKGDEIPVEARILTILDIYDALTAKDRPYKRGMPAEKALFILEDMAKGKKVDETILDVFKQSGVWED